MIQRPGIKGKTTLQIACKNIGYNVFPSIGKCQTTLHKLQGKTKKNSGTKKIGFTLHKGCLKTPSEAIWAIKNMREKECKEVDKK